MEREVHSILGPLGVKEELSRLVAEDLRAVEDGISAGGADNGAVMGVEAVSSPQRSSSPDRKRNWFGRLRNVVVDADAEAEDGGVKGSEELGLTAFMLKFGEGLGGSII